MIIKTLLIAATLTTTTQGTTDKPSETPPPERSAYDMLLEAEGLANEKKYQESADLIQNMLDTQLVNRYTKIIAYWDLYLNYLHIDEKKVAHYLTLFYAASTGYYDSLDDEFIKKFNLDDKLEFTEIIINITWMKKSKTFGKTKEFPFPLRSNRYMQLFVEKEREKEYKNPIKETYYYTYIPRNFSPTNKGAKN